MAYPNLVTKSQRCAKSCDLYEKQTKYCRVIRISSQNNPCGQDNLERVIDMQHFKSFDISAVYRVKDSSCNGEMLPPKGLEANPTKLFQAVVQQNMRELQALGRRAKKYGPATIREAQIAVPEVLG